MARFGSLRHPWQRLLYPYRTHDLCPVDLCPRVAEPSFKCSLGIATKHSRPRSILATEKSSNLGEHLRLLQNSLCGPMLLP
jgi:hypothetical protein